VVHIKVVDFFSGVRPAAWVGTERQWRTSSAPEGVFLEPDPFVQLRDVDPESGYFGMTIAEADEKIVAARLTEAGPILGRVAVSGLRLYAGAEANFGIVETYEDGTELIEMGIVMSPVLFDVSLEVRLVVGGVVFEDGTVVKRIGSADFNPLGETSVRFLRPAVARTSVCHKLSTFQGTVYLGQYR
jgi:hypothetical protein